METIRQVHEGKKRIPPEVVARMAKPPSDETLTVHEVEKVFIIEDNVKETSHRRLDSSPGTLQRWFSHFLRRK